MYFQNTTTMRRKYVSSHEHKLIHNAFKNGNLVMFIGAGFTANFGVEMWEKSVQSIINKVKEFDDVIEDEDRKSYLDYLSEFRADPRIKLSLLTKFTSLLQKDELELYQVLLDTFIKSREEIFNNEVKIDSVKMNIAKHMSVLNLSYVTTNFDNVIELITGINRIIDLSDIEEVKNFEDVKKGIVHLHGYLNEQDICDSISDLLTFDFNSYIKQYYENENSLINKIFDLNDETVFLFLGSSMTEIEIINAIYRKRKSNVKFIAVKGFKDELDYEVNIQFYKDFGIEILGYEVKENKHNLFKYLVDFILTELSSIQSPQQNIDMISKVTIDKDNQLIKEIILDIEKYDFLYSQKLIDGINEDGLFDYFFELGLLDFFSISSNYMYLMNYVINQAMKGIDLDKLKVKRLILDSFEGLKESASYYPYFNTRLNILLLLFVDEFSTKELSEIFDGYKHIDCYLYDENVVDLLISIPKNYRMIILEHLVEGILKRDFSKLAFNKLDKSELFETYVNRINTFNYEHYMFLSAKSMINSTYNIERKLFLKIVEIIAADRSYYYKGITTHPYVELKLLFAVYYKTSSNEDLIISLVEKIGVKELINSHKFYSELKDYFYFYNEDKEELRCKIETAEYTNVAPTYIEDVKRAYLDALKGNQEVLEDEIKTRIQEEFKRESAADILDSIRNIDSLEEIFLILSKSSHLEYDLRDSVKTEIVKKIDNKKIIWKNVDLYDFNDFMNYYFDIIEVLKDSGDFDNDFENERVLRYLSDTGDYNLLWRYSQYFQTLSSNGIVLNTETYMFVLDFVITTITKFDELFDPIYIDDESDNFIFIPSTLSYLFDIYNVLYREIDEVYRINFIMFEKSFTKSNEFWYYLMGYLSQFNAIDYHDETVRYYEEMEKASRDIFLRGYIVRSEFRLGNPFEKEVISNCYSSLFKVAKSDFEFDILSNLYCKLFEISYEGFQVSDVIINEDILKGMLYNFQTSINDQTVDIYKLFLDEVLSYVDKLDVEVFDRVLFTFDQLDEKGKTILVPYIAMLMERVNSFKDSYLGNHIFNVLMNITYSSEIIGDVELILNTILDNSEIDLSGLTQYKEFMRSVNLDQKGRILDVLSSGRFSYH